MELTYDKIGYVLEKLEESDFSNWPKHYTSEDEYNNWKYGIESKDGKIFSNMVKDLPNNSKPRKLFYELFSFSVPSIILIK